MSIVTLALPLALAAPPPVQEPQEGARVELVARVVQEDDGSIAPPPSDDLFPPAKGEMLVTVHGDGTSMTLWEVVQEYCRVTDQHVVVPQDSRSYLDSSVSGLDRSLAVPPSEVQSFFEELLVENDFVLELVREREPRLLSITSLMTGQRNTIRDGARFIDEADIAVAASHPAMLFTTSVHLPHLDVRQVSNSMRSMITDANTQQMLPVGNSNTLVVTGFGENVAYLVDLLKRADEDAAASQADVVHRVVRLQHANPIEIANSVHAALRASRRIRGQEPQMQQGPQGAPPHVSILPYARLNAVLVTCDARDLAEVEEVIAALDVEEE